jgi:phosphopantothenoylcysteine decarboxylase/phosphopantothenate--cysteine ligase
MTDLISELKGKRLLLGVTGGIAAYKAATLARLLTKAGADVRAVLTEAATHFVGVATFQALTGQQVWTDQWDTRVTDGMAHITLTRDRDLIVVAPASADFMARVAQGLGDDLLSTLALARRCPLMLAPAMNVEMWENPATQRNLRLLREDGVAIVGPAPGDQACGETGMGRLVEPEELAQEVDAFFQPKRLAGRRVLVTAGPTQEAIDPVRVITNSSSGKMGYAVARAAREGGAEVVLISGPVSLPAPSGVRRIDVRSAREMFDAVKQNVTDCDVFVSVAAVSDYRLKEPFEQKIKKESAPSPRLELVSNPDILAHVAAIKNGPLCVGFAAESEQLLENARRKRERKGVPLLAANLVQDALGKDENTITLFDDKGAHELGRGSKLDQARKLMSHVATMLEAKKR